MFIFYNRVTCSNEHVIGMADQFVARLPIVRDKTGFEFEKGSRLT